MKEKEFFEKLPHLTLKEIEQMYIDGIFNSRNYNSNGIFIPIDAENATMVSAKKLIELYDKKLILPYMRNRGMGKISQKTIDDLCENLDPPSLMVLVLSELPFERLMMCDFHTRMLAIKKHFKQNPLAEDFNIMVQVCSIHNAFKRYINLNSNNAHTSQNKLTNKDYPFGSVIKPILDANNLKMKFSSHLAQICMCYGSEKQNITYPSVYAARKKDYIKKIKLTFYEITNLNDETLQHIKQAVSRYKTFIELLENNYASDLPIHFKRFKRNVAFFSYFVVECLKENSLFNRYSTEVIASKLFPIITDIHDFTQRVMIGISNFKIEQNTTVLDERFEKLFKRKGSATPTLYR